MVEQSGTQPVSGAGRAGDADVGAAAGVEIAQRDGLTSFIRGKSAPDGGNVSGKYAILGEGISKKCGKLEKMGYNERENHVD